MAKELVLAILLGSFLGFGIAGTSFGVKKIITKVTVGPKITAPTPNQNYDSSQILLPSPDKPTATPATSQNQDIKLSITSPSNYSLFSQSDIEIIGQTKPKYTIFIQNNGQEYLTTADESGNFKQQLHLNQNLNSIELTSISPDNQEENLTLFITYSNAKI